MTKTLSNAEARLMDEFRGLIVEAFADAQRGAGTNHAANGDLVYRQMIRARALFDRIKEYYQPAPLSEEILKQPPAAPATNGQHKPQEVRK